MGRAARAAAFGEGFWLQLGLLLLPLVVLVGLVIAIYRWPRLLGGSLEARKEP